MANFDDKDLNKDQRKVQNRIAQREFRQRKQQYIRDLEARVKLLESNRDDQVTQLCKVIQRMIDENERLRELLASVSGFIGEGIGGYLPRLGFEVPEEFSEFLNRNRMETVHAEIETDNWRHKPFASDDELEDDDDGDFGSSAKRGASTAPTSAEDRTGDERDTRRKGRHAVPACHTEATMSLEAEAGPGLDSVFRLLASSSSAADANHRGGAQMPRFKDMASVVDSEDPDSMDAHVERMTNLGLKPDDERLQAIQIISYHMRNKAQNPDYVLPPSLRTTVTQQTVPHTPFFDGIIFASLRDRLILLKDQYDMSTLLTDIILAFSLHGNDILLPSNWELSESFIKKYWYVVDQEVLVISNFWRQQRGEPELRMQDIIPEDSHK